jgi:hypothetical protein
MSTNDRDAAIKRGQAKADKQAKGKKAGKKKGAASAADGPSVAGHPRALAQVRRAKGLGGVGGFGLAALLGLKAGIPPDQIGERALAAGVAGYMLAWACAVTVWRHLVLAELRTLADRALAAAEAHKTPTVSLQAAEQPLAEPNVNS